MLGGLAGLGIAWLITLGGSPVPQHAARLLSSRLATSSSAPCFAVALGLVAGAIPALPGHAPADRRRPAPTAANIQPHP